MLLLEKAPLGEKLGCPGSIVNVPASAETEQKRRSAALLKSEVRILVILIIAEIWRRDAPNFYARGQVFFMV